MLTIDQINELQELVQDKLEQTKNKLEKQALTELDNTLAELLGSLQ